LQGGEVTTNLKEERRPWNIHQPARKGRQNGRWGWGKNIGKPFDHDLSTAPDFQQKEESSGRLLVGGGAGATPMEKPRLDLNAKVR